MSKHILFILNPGFQDGDDGPFFCPHSAALEGLLKYVPELNTTLDVRRIEFQRPRKEVIELLGEENQSTPVLILAKGTPPPAEAQVSAETGRAFIQDEIEISNFLHKEFGFMKPH